MNASADPAPEVTCEICGKSMPQGKEARRHKTNCGKFTCDICKKDFPSKRAVVRHKQIHTEKNKCERCEKVFSAKQALDRHIRGCGIVEKNDEFLFNVCQTTFSTKGSLVRHQKNKKHGVE